MVNKKLILIISIILLIATFVLAANIYSDLDMKGNAILNVTNIGATTNEIQNIYVETNSRIYFGNGQEYSIYYNGSALIIG